jgi:hypothetical protein
VENALPIPTETQFKTTILEYRKRENRGAVYFRALDRVNTGYGNAEIMADGIGLLLKSWHNAFYRFGPYDPLHLIDCLKANMSILAALRQRTIYSFCSKDESEVRQLFRAFTGALRGGKNGAQESTVATAKALHLLAPGLLPLWDNSIAYAYGQFPMLADNYLAFCWQMKDLAEALQSFIPDPDDCTVLKRLDEFSYAVYTKRWLAQNPV